MGLLPELDSFEDREYHSIDSPASDEDAPEDLPDENGSNSKN